MGSTWAQTPRRQRPAKGSQAQKLTQADSLLGQGQRTSAYQRVQAPFGTWNTKPGTQGSEGRARTTDVLLHPREGDATFLAALTEAQQKGPRGLGAQDGSLPLLADEPHDVPGQEEARTTNLGQVTGASPPGCEPCQLCSTAGLSLATDILWIPRGVFTLNQQKLSQESAPAHGQGTPRHQDGTCRTPYKAQRNHRLWAGTHPSFHSTRMYFFTKSMMLSSQTQKEKPLPAMFS